MDACPHLLPILYRKSSLANPKSPLSSSLPPTSQSTPLLPGLSHKNHPPTSQSPTSCPAPPSTAAATRGLSPFCLRGGAPPATPPRLGDPIAPRPPAFTAGKNPPAPLSPTRPPRRATTWYGRGTPQPFLRPPKSSLRPACPPKRICREGGSIATHCAAEKPISSLSGFDLNSSIPNHKS